MRLIGSALRGSGIKQNRLFTEIVLENRRHGDGHGGEKVRWGEVGRDGGPLLATSASSSASRGAARDEDLL